MRPKKCKSCKEIFTPTRPLQQACSPLCAIELVKLQRAKKEAKEHREAKQRIKSRADWMREAQAAFNAYIRVRDAHLPCVSCGRFHEGQWHAGHYRTTKAAPELRFHPFNNNKQCPVCNNHLSGNIVEYRPRLIEKIGLTNVEWLEGPHQVHKWTIDDLKEIKSYYKDLLKTLQQNIP